jgi:cadmium resistance protein CadD (predicted permease)
VTIANGGDNLGVYIPLFASDVGMVPFYAGVFAALTAVWCLAGYLLVQNRLIGPQVRRFGHLALPFVLVALGLWILADARVLLP